MIFFYLTSIVSDFANKKWNKGQCMASSGKIVPNTYPMEKWKDGIFPAKRKLPKSKEHFIVIKIFIVNCKKEIINSDLIFF